MQMSTTFLKWTKNRFEAVGRARVWAVLRAMDGEFLRQAGFEPELLEKGPDAWPWRAGNDEIRSRTDRPGASKMITAQGPPIPIKPPAQDGSDPPRAPPSSEPGPRHLAA